MSLLWERARCSRSRERGEGSGGGGVLFWTERGEGTSEHQFHEGEVGGACKHQDSPTGRR